MTPVMRILDGDLESLERRVARAVETLGSSTTVSRFTLWYTCRPPVHGALLRLPGGLDGQAPVAEAA